METGRVIPTAAGLRQMREGLMWRLRNRRGLNMKKLVILAAALALSSCGEASGTNPRDAQTKCLSGMSGAHLEMRRVVRSRMREPSSFEHIETRVTAPVSNRQTVFMTFRARNGFGGMTLGAARADINHATCAMYLDTLVVADH